MKKFYISTPIYYSSGDPHIGHAYTTILADTLNRYKKLLNYETFFITGMDEHGQKIELSAQKFNLSCQEFVDKNSSIFEDLWKKLDIKPTFFIRTSNEKHKLFVQEKFSYLYNKNFIYLDNWRSFYCIQCEEDIINNKIKIIDEKKFCEHGHEIIERSEESFFLKTEYFKDWIISIIKDNNIKIIPENRIKELNNNFLNDEFRDLSISRNNIKWGIEIKENLNHKIYVWFDALFNYLSGLYIYNDKYIDEIWNSKNTEIVHLLSKEITRFHCIYWPILLKMLNYNMPTKIICHGWIITHEGKMSKSIGNVVDPFILIEKYGSDALRYFLMKEISINNDSIFSEELLISTYNSDLCNNFGNLINRSIGLLKKYNNGKIPEYKETIREDFIYFENEINRFINEIIDLINLLDVNFIIKRILNFEKSINSFIEYVKPWDMFKKNEIIELNIFLSLLLNSIKILIFFISPILVQKSIEAWNQLNFPKNIFNINEIKNMNNIDNIITKESIILFKRIEKDEN